MSRIPRNLLSRRNGLIRAGNGAAIRDLESISGKNGFALIFAKSGHGSMLFP
jgi:hypothetical protein